MFETTRNHDRLPVPAAIARLKSALDAHRRAGGDWRAAMAELEAGLAGLGTSLRHYEATLAGLESRLAEWRRELGSAAKR